MLKKNRAYTDRGFALLFSVMLSSVLLTIGLSIFSIALKELSISTAARQSIYAFYAADTGREYLLWRDIKMNNIGANNIGGSYSFSSDVGAAAGPNYKASLSRVSTTTGYCTVTKAFCTIIISRGYDTASDDKVERAIRQTY